MPAAFQVDWPWRTRVMAWGAAIGGRAGRGAPRRPGRRAGGGLGLLLVDEGAAVVVRAGPAGAAAARIEDDASWRKNGNE